MQDESPFIQIYFDTIRCGTEWTVNIQSGENFYIHNKTTYKHHIVVHREDANLFKFLSNEESHVCTCPPESYSQSKETTVEIATVHYQLKGAQSRFWWEKPEATLDKFTRSQIDQQEIDAWRYAFDGSSQEFPPIEQLPLTPQTHDNVEITAQMTARLRIESQRILAEASQLDTSVTQDELDLLQSPMREGDE
jgi:hypothetical protein